jgi:hypothetical protein
MGVGIMKKFKCIASKRVEKKGTKNVIKQNLRRIYVFWFQAENFSQAITKAERIAKGMLCFESLKVSEV